jgi:hypothetical protein
LDMVAWIFKFKFVQNMYCMHISTGIWY